MNTKTFKGGFKFKKYEGSPSEKLISIAIDENIERTTQDWQNLSPQKIEEIISFLDFSSLKEFHNIENLIIHAIDSEPFPFSLNILLNENNFQKFIDGIKILKKIMPKTNIHLALNKDDKEIIKKLETSISDIDNLKTYTIEAKYPQEFDQILIPTILNKSAMDISVNVLNIQAVLYVYEAVAEGKPSTNQLIALCGSSFKENVYAVVKIGTPLEDVLKDRLKDNNCRIIINSILTGYKAENLQMPIDRTISKIIAIPENTEREFMPFLAPGLKKDSYSYSFLSSIFQLPKSVETNLHGEERPCIQCGYCVSACPVAIMPIHLSRMAKVNINDKLKTFGIEKCIDCNLCSFVCPAKIPLAQHIKSAKTKLTEIGKE